MAEDVFCKIIKKVRPAEFVDEDESFIVIKDIRPKAPIHLLIIPKKHIISIKELKEDDLKMAGELILKAKTTAEKLNIDGYKLIFNVGRQAGQIVDHLHLHLLAG